MRENFPSGGLKYYRMLKEGQNWRDLPSELQQEAMGASWFRRRRAHGIFTVGWLGTNHPRHWLPDRRCLQRIFATLTNFRPLSVQKSTPLSKHFQKGMNSVEASTTSTDRSVMLFPASSVPGNSAPPELRSTEGA